MGMTGDTATAVSIVCPSCGERYNSPERVADILRNSGFCTNLTCLEDLSSQPLDVALARPQRQKDSTRRSTDRRAI